MAITQNTYNGDGSTVLFSFTFPYIETTDIKVRLDGVLETNFTLANATTIQFATAPANGVRVDIYRETDIDEKAATFYPGSAIRSSDLNENFDQILYTVQEVDNNAWSKITNTISSNEPWVSDDNNVATNRAMDDRFVDHISAETISGVKTFTTSPVVPTTPSGGTAATNKTYVDTEINDKINDALTNDIGTDGTGITVTDDGDGTVTLGIAPN